MKPSYTIRCMQLPLTDLQILVPNSAVAEIISYTPPDKKGSEWLDGLVFWRGVTIPVVSLEKMCQSNSVEPGSRSRIAVLYNVERDAALPYVGIILQDIPRAYLAEVDRMQDVVDAPDCPYLQCKADMMIDQLMIPDMDAIMASVKQKTKGLSV